VEVRLIPARLGRRGLHAALAQERRRPEDEPQDIRDEMKSTEGNPASKARIRRLQRQARRKQMIKATRRRRW
jgi:hypothetical protein